MKAQIFAQDLVWEVFNSLNNTRYKTCDDKMCLIIGLENRINSLSKFQRLSSESII